MCIRDRVDIRAASINPLDKMIRNGEFKQLIKYKPPFALGHDLSGVITAVGSDVRGFAVGDEIYARPRDGRIGAFAGTIAIDAGDVARKPTSLSVSYTHLDVYKRPLPNRTRRLPCPRRSDSTSRGGRRNPGLT